MSDRTRRAEGWRAAAFAAALFAITLNFLQPLLHAALMRDRGPSGLWTAFCNPSTQEPRKDTAPVAAGQHECCLGLAHAEAVPAPSTGFSTVAQIVTSVRPLPASERQTPVGIRDGPYRPRGPPSFV
jgi:hypothetical protein